MEKSRRLTRRNVLQGAGATAGMTGLLATQKVWAQTANSAIKFVNINSNSGPFSRYGQEIQRGIDIALDAINKKGLPIGGKTYTIDQHIYDDKSDAETSAKLIERAVTIDNANMVIASLGSVIVKSCIPVAQRLQFPMMTHWAQVDGVFAGQKGNPYFYGCMPPFSHMYTSICTMLATFKDPKISSVAMITTKDELGVFSANNYLPQDLKAAGLRNAGTEFFPPQSQQYASALDRIQRAKPDALIVNCYSPDIIGVLKEMQATKQFPPAIVVEAPTQLYESIGDAANGCIVPAFWDPSLNVTQDEFIGRSRDFTSIYKAKHGKAPPDFVAACGAMNVIAYALIMHAAGTISDPAMINKSFRSFSGETFFSKLTFNDLGLNEVGEVYPSQFQAGLPVIVAPPDLRQAAPITPYPGYKKT